MSRCGTPAARSSQAVSRPWLRGRVSLTTTSTAMPSACAAYTGASAVPAPQVASQPALQCVIRRTGPGRRAAISRIRRTPWRPIASQVAASSARIASASAHAASTRAAGGKGCSARRMRSSAQCRFTAVGRVAPRVASARPSVASAAPSSASASATPKAAVAPISGAPRTCMLRMACAASARVRSATVSVRKGSRVWSRMRTVPPSRCSVGMGCSNIGALWWSGGGAGRAGGAYSAASLVQAAASVASFLAKQKRITCSSRPSAKKADTGIAATPTSRVRYSQKAASPRSEIAA